MVTRLPVSGLLEGEPVTVKIRNGTLEARALYEKECEGENCGEMLLWARTPRGANMPIDLPIPIDEPAVCHFATCPDHARFRK